MVNQFSIMRKGMLRFLWDIHSCCGELIHHYVKRHIVVLMGRSLTLWWINSPLCEEAYCASYGTFTRIMVNRLIATWGLLHPLAPPLTLWWITNKDTSHVPILREEVPNELKWSTSHCGESIHRNARSHSFSIHHNVSIMKKQSKEFCKNETKRMK